MALVGIFFVSTLAKYQIRLYINENPSDYGAQETRRCYSFTPNFTCEYRNPVVGMYVKAVTFEGDEIISESDWEVVV